MSKYAQALTLVLFSFLLNGTRMEESEQFKASEQVEEDVLNLRTIPRSDLVRDTVRAFIEKLNMYDVHLNPRGLGIKNDFILLDKIIVDKKTRLNWQSSSSEEMLDFDDAVDHIEELNEGELPGYTPWRLPTIEEAMSLMEPTLNTRKLHINRAFNTEAWIWTCDREKPDEPRWFGKKTRIWVVNFRGGECTIPPRYEQKLAAVLAVRKGSY